MSTLSLAPLMSTFTLPYCIINFLFFLKVRRYYTENCFQKSAQGLVTVKGCLQHSLRCTANQFESMIDSCDKCSIFQCHWDLPDRILNPPCYFPHLRTLGTDLMEAKYSVTSLRILLAY